MREIKGREFKKHLIYILEKVARYCNENGIVYYLSAGTLLGAARDGQIIPWDNDVDIMMPISSYDEFISKTQVDPISDDLYVSAPGVNASHYWPMTKVFLTSTYMKEKRVLSRYAKRAADYRGIYIDVFPIYGLPEDKRERRRFCEKLWELWRDWRQSLKKPHTNNPFRYLSMLRAAMPYRKIGPADYIRKMNEMIHEYDPKDTRLCACTIGASGSMRDVFSYDQMQGDCSLRLEKDEFKVPSDYDGILHQYYGDYKTLPPENERITHSIKAYYR